MKDDSDNSFNKELFAFIKQNWFSKRALLALLLLEVLFLLPYLWKNFGIGVNKSELIALLVVVIVTVLLWLWSRRYPKNAKNKIGVLVAVTTESRKEYVKLRADLISKIKEVVRIKRKENIFNVIELPEYYSSKIQDHPSSIKALEKAGAHFIIYGSCKKRMEQGINNYFMNLEATVLHKPIPQIISNKFSQEFAELFPRKVIFPIENEISGFEITKDLIGFVARYI